MIAGVNIVALLEVGTGTRGPSEDGYETKTKVNRRAVWMPTNKTPTFDDASGE